MATRQETSQRRSSLCEEMRRSCRDGSWHPGELLPSVRELAQQHEVSVKMMSATIATLTEEGLLSTVPRVGIFVGKPPAQEADVYLLVVPRLESRGFLSQIQMGFEDRITQLGGISLTLLKEEVLEMYAQGELPRFKAVFETEGSPLGAILQGQGIPHARFGEVDDTMTDTIHFDDFDGGRQATRHLVSAGHRRIAFLGLHTLHDKKNDLYWSQKREAGWLHVIEGNGGNTDLAFRPSDEVGPSPESQINGAREAAEELVIRDDIDAVVVVNEMAVQGLFEALQHARVPVEKWPAIIGFDDDTMTSLAVVSYLRLSWDLVGREAASLLQGRVSGKIQGPAQEKLIAMRLIPRISCRRRWTSTSSFHKRLITGTSQNTQSLSATSGQF